MKDQRPLQESTREEAKNWKVTLTEIQRLCHKDNHLINGPLGFFFDQLRSKTSKRHTNTALDLAQKAPKGHEKQDYLATMVWIPSIASLTGEIQAPLLYFIHSFIYLFFQSRTGRYVKTDQWTSTKTCLEENLLKIQEPSGPQTGAKVHLLTSQWCETQDKKTLD